METPKAFSALSICLLTKYPITRPILRRKPSARHHSGGEYQLIHLGDEVVSLDPTMPAGPFILRVAPREDGAERVCRPHRDPAGLLEIRRGLRIIRARASKQEEMKFGKSNRL